jgi:hypothetical protein
VDGASRKVLWRTKEELSFLLDGESCLGCIVQVAIADLDANGINEVLALVPYDGLFAYDGRTGDLLWNRKHLAGAWAFTVADIAPSPGSEIIVPIYGDDRIAIYDSTGQTLILEKDLSPYGSGISLQVVDLDRDGERELVVVADLALLILSARTLEVLWSGGTVLPWLSVGNQLVIADVDGDTTTEIVVPSAHSLHVFEYRAATQDVSPPDFGGALRASSAPGCCVVSLDWSPASDAASMPVKYRVYRATAPNFNPHPDLLVRETQALSHVDRSLVRGITYHYAVTAVDGAGNETVLPLRVSADGPDSCRTKGRAVRSR